MTRARGQWTAIWTAVVIGACGGGPPPASDAGGGGSSCVDDSECDDALFCNGVARCDPGAAGADDLGCVRGAPPCLEAQRCDEATDECRSVCSISADADRDGAEAIACGGTDCDDSDPDRSPLAVEVCDAANVDEDCDPTTFGGRDADGDDFIDALCCNTDEETGSMRCGNDCSDVRRDMHPGLAETCDSLDNDCDTVTDETASVAGFADADHDLHGVATSPMIACPDTPGFSTVGDDCDDADPAVHRAQVEICDGKDNDCDARIDEAPAAVTWYPDDDDDGFGAPGDRTIVSCVPVPAYSLRPSDCDDTRRDRSPAAREVCNGQDDDCDGLADFTIRPGDLEDDDGDGHPDRACGGSDCDDADATVHPGAPELCDGKDNDCDGVTDGADAMALWYLDLDGDGFGSEASPPIEDCDPQPARVTRAGDCNDADASYRPGVADGCDGIDRDCDGTVDEGAVRFAYYPDADRDGWGDVGGAIELACRDALGRSTRPGDCADSDPVAHPTATELCDDLDNDCDLMIDEDAPQQWYIDADGDGHGVDEGALTTCLAPAGYAPLTGDCDDGAPARFPGAVESCDLLDNDCNGTVDDVMASACLVSAGVGMCTLGECQVMSCTTGYASCDGRFESGCEVDTRTNAAHCGGCGAPCPTGDTCGRTTPGTCDGSRFVAVTVGESHSFALRTNGGLLGWGASTSGQVGSGTTSDVPAPVLVSTDALSISAGLTHSCMASTARRVWCWGDNSYGQLGDGTFENRVSPTLVLGLTGVVEVSVGAQHSCARKTDGTIWCWGDRRVGQLGDGTIDSFPTTEPVQVTGITDAIEIATGTVHGCARRPLATGGSRVQCWGAASAGQLGNGTTSPDRATPGDVVGLPTDVVGLSHGIADHTCARLSSGRARCWGRSDYGALATGTDATVVVAAPAAMTVASGAEADTIAEVCVGLYMSCVIRSGGVVWCAGADDYGQLGDGLVERSDSARLQQVLGADGLPLVATAIGCGRNHACAARSDGSVVCWGNDTFENLGNGPASPDVMSPIPRPILGL